MFGYSSKTDPRKALKIARAQVDKALRRLDLASFISLNEIEEELKRVETVFKSLLLLGILRRIMSREDDEAAKLFVPAVTEWKNYLPHDDLDGMTPFEYQEKYPPGPYEGKFIAGLLEEYQSKLESIKDGDQSFNIEKDFTSFQKEYLARTPSDQLMASGPPRSLKELIIEERRLRGHSEKDIDKIGAHVFAENTADGLGWQAAKIDDQYYEIVNELAETQVRQRALSKKKMENLLAFFENHEPYYRCGPEPQRFYLNYASVLILDNDVKKAVNMLDKALARDSNYQLARDMKARVKKFLA